MRDTLLTGYATDVMAAGVARMNRPQASDMPAFLPAAPGFSDMER
ncbi:hypothetical protein EZJ58_1379 [Sodalis ligni]|jgi:hypothetical protein|uniref:Uncharacterized protein n=1 Tax=Sodalis ligni TaxID=2697027 RepID=A0A4R1N9G2_9GAMM|nr:hypothetical protein EZJ58_1379 [Sodalis ligni]